MNLFYKLMKKCFSFILAVFFCLACQTEKISQRLSPIELSFEQSQYRLTMGQKNFIDFTVSGIDGASVTAFVTLRNAEWNAVCSLDPVSGKGVLEVTPPQKIGVATAEVAVIDEANDRKATLTLPLASTADGMPLILKFSEEEYTIKAGEESIELAYSIEGLSPAVMDIPTESDVKTTVAVESVTWDAVKATGVLKISAPETHKGGRTAISFTVRDDYFREVTAMVYVNVVVGASLPVSYNCYIVTPGQTLTFSKKYRSVKSVSLAWQDVSDLIASVGMDGDNVKVSTKAGTAGNALVLGKNADDETVWSWHIWVTDFDPDATAVTVDGFTFMDRNLGAVNATVGDVGAIGQAYQWGRKDPMPRVASITIADNIASSTGDYDIYDASGAAIVEDSGDNTYYKILGATTMAVSIAKPDYFITAASDRAWWTDGEDAHADWWGGSSLTKSEYDPCPQGWKVPVIEGNANPYNFITTTAAVYDAIARGVLYTGSNGQKLWFPSNGQRSRSKGWIHAPYRDGNYWLGTDMDDDSYSRANYMYFCDSGKSLSKKIDRDVFTVLGCAVRCVKED